MNSAMNLGSRFPILIVEDNPGLAELMRAALADAGLSSVCVATGQAALERIAAERLALIILDYDLPDMTGMELVEILAAQFPVPPFIITGRDDASLAVRLMKQGARDYLMKDGMLLDRLAAVVSRVVRETETEQRLREAEAALRGSEARLAKAQQIAPVGCWEWNLESDELSCSHGIFSIFGQQLRPGETLTMDAFLRWAHPHDRSSVHAALTGLRETGTPCSVDFRIVCADSAEKVVRVQAELELDEQGLFHHLAGTMLDITDQRRAEQEIRKLAYYDTLTALPNRTLLEDRLRQAIAQARRDGRSVGVMMLDLDRFKSVNESLGYLSGDRLLKAVAERLAGCVRSCDTVARLGGDDFVIVLSALTQEEHITAIAKKVLAVLSSPIRLGGQELFTTASIGISIFPLDGEDPPTLLKNADMAMYQAKEQGRNTLQFFSREMNARAEERLKLENSLRRALERNELFLHYQPQVNLQTGAAVGMEALLRWQHPELGLLSPLKFIPIAEENGLIVPIGEWVLRTACAQTKAWQEAGFGPLRVAVNLSGRQFKQPDFVERVAEILKQTGLPPSCLELELTESIIMSNGEETIRILQKLKNMGVTLAIDDFGTGYSSLSYLKHFPIDRLKIDRSFVLDIPHDPDNAAIAEAIIVLAHSLKLQVTAEGVEQSDQLEFLATRQCDELQGYYVSRPVAAQDFAALLVEGISLRRPAPALASMPARSCRTRTARA